MHVRLWKMAATNTGAVSANIAAANIINTNIRTSQNATPTSAATLSGSFRILDSVADVLALINDGRDEAVSDACTALFARFSAADALLDTLAGAELTRRGQLEEAKRLRAELESKTDLVAKYRKLALLNDKVSFDSTSGDSNTANPEKEDESPVPAGSGNAEANAVLLNESNQDAIQNQNSTGNVPEEKLENAEMADDIQDLVMDF